MRRFGLDVWFCVRLLSTISANGKLWRIFSALTAVLGTTIVPNLLFWQSGEEVEQMESEPKDRPLKRVPQQAPEQLQ
jgi:hypothetical protein